MNLLFGHHPEGEVWGGGRRKIFSVFRTERGAKKKKKTEGARSYLTGEKWKAEHEGGPVLWGIDAGKQAEGEELSHNTHSGGEATVRNR